MTLYVHLCVRVAMTRYHLVTLHHTAEDSTKVADVAYVR